MKQLGAMWLYTLLRIGLFLVLWGIVYFLGVEALLAALIAAVLSIPLAFVLLARPREAFARSIQENTQARVERRMARDAELEGGDSSGPAAAG